MLKWKLVGEGQGNPDKLELHLRSKDQYIMSALFLRHLILTAFSRLGTEDNITLAKQNREVQKARFHVCTFVTLLYRIYPTT